MCWSLEIAAAVNDISLRSSISHTAGVERRVIIWSQIDYKPNFVLMMCLKIDEIAIVWRLQKLKLHKSSTACFSLSLAGGLAKVVDIYLDMLS